MSQQAIVGPLAVIAKITALPGRRDELAVLLNEAGDHAEQEAGTISFVTHEDRDSPDNLWVYELYADEQSHKIHMGSDASVARLAIIRTLEASPPEVHFLTPLGDSDCRS
jgi:quinol monooxygenase YgiN